MATGVLTAKGHPDGPRDLLASGYRADIDGLRALSILLVVAFHAGLTWFGGGFVGVDVFFVISGFLITGILIDEAAKRGTVSLTGFFARRIRRLLPLSALVLGATVVAGLILLPPIDRATLLADARAAALYFANWRFAGQAGAYSETGPTDSLFTHYWSLSIEEQFYLMWPLLVLVVARVVMRRRPEHLRGALMLVLTMLAVASFAASIVLTRTQGTSIYYGTHVRIGELAVGALLAAMRPNLHRLAPRVAEGAGVAGLGLIVIAAMSYGPETPFPGAAVLVPVTGSALVLVAGFARTRVRRALSVEPLPALGRVSYGWYLWHWPAIGVAFLLAGDAATPGQRTAVTMIAVVVSLMLAVASHRLVENPIRHARRLARSPRLSLAVGAGLTLLSVGMTLVPLTGDSGATRPVAVTAGEGEPLVLGMTPEEAQRDSVPGMRRCHTGFQGVEVSGDCTFGDPDGTLTIALSGDSIAQQWFPAFELLAREQGWRLLAWTKSACPPAEVRFFNGRLNREYTECASWRAQVVDRLRTVPGGVDLVVLGRRAYHKGILDENGRQVTREAMPRVWREGARRMFEQLRAVAPRVLVLEDTPTAPWNIPRCLSETPEEPARCSFPADRASDRDDTLVAAERAAGVVGVSFADLTRRLCPQDPCPPVTRDGVIIYRDGHHMTATFSRSLADAVLDLVRPLLA